MFEGQRIDEMGSNLAFIRPPWAPTQAGCSTQLIIHCSCHKHRGTPKYRLTNVRYKKTCGKMIFRRPLKCSITFPILSIWVSGSSHGPTLLIIEQRMVFERHALVGARKRLCFSFGRSLNSYSDQQFSSEQLNFDKTLNFKLDLFSFVFYLSTTFAMQKGDTQLFKTT